VQFAGYPQQDAAVEGFPLPQGLRPGSAFDAGMSLGAVPAGAIETRVYLYVAPCTSQADTLWEVEVPTTATYAYLHERLLVSASSHVEHPADPK